MQFEFARFDFATAGRIVFGRGAFAQLPEIAAGFGQRALVVTGKRGARARAHASFTVASEPEIDTIRAGVEVFRGADCDHVIAIGGGSAIDAGKAIAAAAANPGDLLEYVEVIGKGHPLPCAPYPFIAVPTTAGTGSEATRNAVLGSRAHGVKVSLRSASMLARVAIVDPELTDDLPPAMTASTGLDALTQLIEAYVSLRANPFTDALCISGIEHAVRSLPRAFANGADREARGEMAYASLLGGLALANAGLGVVHGFAAAIGGMFGAPHGAVCAALLPYGMQANISALYLRDPDSAALVRYNRVAQIMTGDPEASGGDGALWIRHLVQQLEIPPLSAWGVTREHAEELSRKATHSSSMRANPILLHPDELIAVIAATI